MDSRRRLVRQLRKVEREIGEAKGKQKQYQRWMKEEEETIQKLILQQDEGVWRVWSANHCRHINIQ